jgi:hypothetical protein
VGHGIETVTVTRVGKQAAHTNLSANASPGATNIKVRTVNGFSVGDKLTVGTPANQQTVTITGAGASGVTGIDFAPALDQAHIRDEGVISPGTGLDLAAPLQFNHASNMPFSDRGTGISFEPATTQAHSSNEPVQALGAGITLDSPLAQGHVIDSAVRDAAVTTAGYQGTPAPNQWFGGPELASKVPFFERVISRKEGSMILRDASGVVVDSLNYGIVVDPWVDEGYQGVSGAEQSGCHAPTPGAAAGFGPFAAGGAVNASAGRFPDGADTDSNCNDFLTQSASNLAAPSAAGATNIKVASVEGFATGQKVMIDTGANLETALIASVGTPGATTVDKAADVGATVISVASANGFRDGQTISLDDGANSETAVVASVRRFGGTTITVAAPLEHAHVAGAPVSGTGITLASALARAHATGVQVTDNVPTPGQPNHYGSKQH